MFKYCILAVYGIFILICNVPNSLFITVYIQANLEDDIVKEALKTVSDVFTIHIVLQHVHHIGFYLASFVVILFDRCN